MRGGSVPAAGHALSAPSAASGRSRTLIREERPFIAVLGVSLVAAAVSAPYRGAARGAGFALAAYAATANGSVQALGAFPSSDRQRPWWVPWPFASGVLAAHPASRAALLG